MSAKVKPKATPKASKNRAAKRPAIKQDASRKSIDFIDLLDQLAMHLHWRSKNPLKDAAAVRRILLEVRTTNPGRSAPKGTLKSIGTPTHARETTMVKDGRHLKSSTAVKADRPPPSSNLAVLLATVLDQPEKWMATPNRQFGGRKPSDLVGTAEETKIFDLLHAVDQGLF